MSAAPEGGQHFGGPGVAGESWSGGGGTGAAGPHNIAAAVTDVSERVVVLVREEVELAKAEMAEKVSRLARGAVVAVVAGVFFLTALFFVLVGCAWLLYYYLPFNDFAYFWGFFAMAAILIVLGAAAGLLAARAFKRGAPPVPNMALEEARRIRETVAQASSEGVVQASSDGVAQGDSAGQGGEA